MIMERVDLPLSQLTLAQKLDLMETLWADLSRDEKTLNSPDWHQAVLKDREKELEDGSATVSEWKDAKVRIKRNVSCD
jgi:hypothetical protein